MAWIAVILRLYVRLFIVKAFGWDDGWMLFAQLMHTLNSTCAIGGALTGTGRLMKDLTPGSMMMALRVCTEKLLYQHGLTIGASSGGSAILPTA
jgi:uncharacterized RDD family membrane protein YckC